MVLSKTFKENFLLLLFYFLVTLILFHKALGFVFIIDDYAMLIISHAFNISSFGAFRLHPAVVFDSLALFKLTGFSYIWGKNAFFANLMGIFLRSLCAFVAYLFLSKITGSKKIGFLTGFFVVISYVGIQATTWFTAQFVLFDLILTIYASYRYLIFLSTKKRNDFLIFILIFVVNLLLDPGRNFISVIFILFLFLINKVDKKNISFNREDLVRLTFILILTAIIFGVWYFLFRSSIHNIHRFHIEPFRYFFGSISSLILDFKLRPFEFDLSTYKHLSNIYLITDFVIAVSAVSSFALFAKTKSKLYKILSIFFFWIFIFYIPSWISFPREYVPAAHRYLEVAGFGFIAICSFVVFYTFKKNKTLGIILFLIIVYLNLSTTFFYLNQENFYRSNKVVPKFWYELNSKIPQNEKHPLIYISGEYSLSKYGIVWSNSWPIRSMRNSVFDDSKFSPMISQDLDKLINQICSNKDFEKHLYAYEVSNNGDISDIKKQTLSRIDFALKNENECKYLQQKYGKIFSFW